MAKVVFNLTLHGGKDEFDYKRYAPDSEMKGTLTLYPNNTINCKHLYLRLLWHTSGRGSRYTETVSELDLFQGTLQQGLPQSFDFQFVLPHQPWSYEGHYISIVWKIQAQIDVAWASDPKGELGFVLRPFVEEAEF